MLSVLPQVKGLNPAQTTPPSISILLNDGENMEKCYESGTTIVGFTQDRIIILFSVKAEVRVTSVPYSRIASISVTLNKLGKHSGFILTAANGTSLDLRFTEAADRESLYKSIFSRIED